MINEVNSVMIQEAFHHHTIHTANQQFNNWSITTKNSSLTDNCVHKTVDSVHQYDCRQCTSIRLFTQLNDQQQETIQTVMNVT